MNIIAGRGAVALVENPEAFQRRKMQNKKGNQKKDNLRRLGENHLGGSATPVAGPSSLATHVVALDHGVPFGRQTAATHDTGQETRISDSSNQLWFTDEEIASWAEDSSKPPETLQASHAATDPPALSGIGYQFGASNELAHAVSPHYLRMGGYSFNPPSTIIPTLKHTFAIPHYPHPPCEQPTFAGRGAPSSNNDNHATLEQYWRHGIDTGSNAFAAQTHRQPFHNEQSTRAANPGIDKRPTAEQETVDYVQPVEAAGVRRLGKRRSEGDGGVGVNAALRKRQRRTR